MEHTRYAYASCTLRLTARYANSRWSKAGVWERVFQHLAEDVNNKYAMIDFTIVRATSRVQGQRGGCISLSNWSQPKRIKHQNSCSGGCVTPGQTSNLDGADKLLPELVAYTVLADKAYDADERVIEPLQARGKTGVILPRRSCKNLRDYDWELYKARHLIENFFAKLKQYCEIATRYDKRAKNFLGTIIFCCCCHLAQLMTRPRKSNKIFLL